jgi:hypothetical protein
LRTLGLACEVGGEMEIGVERGVLNALRVGTRFRINWPHICLRSRHHNTLTRVLCRNTAI